MLPLQLHLQACVLCILLHKKPQGTDKLLEAKFLQDLEGPVCTGGIRVLNLLYHIMQETLPLSSSAFLTRFLPLPDPPSGEITNLHGVTRL